MLSMLLWGARTMVHCKATNGSIFLRPAAACAVAGPGSASAARDA